MTAITPDGLTWSNAAGAWVPATSPMSAGAESLLRVVRLAHRRLDLIETGRLRQADRSAVRGRFITTTRPARRRS